MRKLLVLPFLLFTCNLAIGQVSKNINPNEVFATFSSYGGLFNDGSFDSPGYINSYNFESKDYPFQILMADIVSVGYSEHGGIFGHTGTYDRDDFYPGPLSSIDGLPIDRTKDLFDEVYKVSGEEILAATIDFEDNGEINSTVSYSLLAWPGRNNPHFESIYGFVQPDEQMAPFLDRNHNGDYEPMLGDIPVIGNRYPDVIPNELLFIMFNDLGYSDGLRLEYHVLAFGFSCDDNQDINQTLFTKTSIFNKSKYINHDMSIGFFTDFDLGCPEDDYIGCDPENNMFYSYNEDDVDGISGSDCNVGGVDLSTFGTSPGVVATKFLNVNMDAFSIYTRTGYGGFSRLQRMAMNLQGVTYVDKGNGFEFDTTPYQYADYPTVVGGDNMVNTDFHNEDFRSISGTTVGDLGPGEQFVLFNSWYSNNDPDLSAHEQPEKLKTSAPIIQQFFDDGFMNCDRRLEASCTSDCVWPGDANADGYVYHDDLLVCGFAIANEIEGSGRTYTSPKWQSYSSMDWTETINSLNAKHADCFGDGVADDVDLQVIMTNYRNVKPGEVEEATAHANVGDTGLKVIFRTTEFEEGRPSVINSILRGKMPLELVFPTAHSVIGYSFTTYLDTSLYDIRSVNFLNEEWEIEENSDYVVHSKTDARELRRDIVVYSNTGSSLQEEVLVDISAFYRIRSDLRVPSGQEKLHLPFPIHDLRAIDVNGDFVNMDLVQDSLFLVREFSSVDDISLSKNISVFPNPSRDVINVEISELSSVSELTLMDQTGRVLNSWKDFGDRLSIVTDNLSNGVYLLRAELDGGNHVLKRVTVIQ